MSATGASIRATRRSKNAPEPGRLLVWFKRVTQFVLALALLLGAGVLGLNIYQYFQSPANFPIGSVKVEGSFQYLDRSTAQQTLEKYARDGFFGMDVDELRAEVVSMPWVESAGVRRVWPDGITLTVSEHKPVARWNVQSLLTESGAVIDPPQLHEGADKYEAWQRHFKALPFLHSESAKPGAAWQQFVQAEKALRSVGVSLYGVQTDRRKAISLVLDNGVSVRLGRGWFDERVSRFVSVYSRYIAPQVDAISYVDLRYPNGFAIGAASATETQ